MKRQLKFWRPDYDQTIEDAEVFEASSCLENDYDFYAEQYADHCFGSRDGWEWEWPVKFCMADMDNKLIGTFIVELEQRPIFTARRD